ncbi:hypothetical protein ACFY64_34770 [Streptomyces collinus]
MDVLDPRGRVVARGRTRTAAAAPAGGAGADLTMLHHTENISLLEE